MSVKRKLLEHCRQLIESKIESIKRELDLLQQAVNEETKSSAGDKYETGRAMMTLEKEKLLTQEGQWSTQLKPLSTIDPDKVATKVEVGSIIETEGATYFVCSSIGQVNLAGITYFVISPLAPIAQAMLGKSSGESFNFNGRSMAIKNIY